MRAAANHGRRGLDPGPKLVRKRRLDDDVRPRTLKMTEPGQIRGRQPRPETHTRGPRADIAFGGQQKQSFAPVDPKGLFVRGKSLNLF